MSKGTTIFTGVLVVTMVVLFLIGFMKLVGNLGAQIDQDVKPVKTSVVANSYEIYTKRLQGILNGLETCKIRGDIAGLKQGFKQLEALVADVKDTSEPNDMKGYYIELIKIYTSWKTVVVLMENINNGGDGDITVVDKNIETANKACRKLLDIYNKGSSTDKITK